MPLISCATGHLKDGAGLTKHDGRIRISSQAWPEFPEPTSPLTLTWKKRSSADHFIPSTPQLSTGYRSWWYSCRCGLSTPESSGRPGPVPAGGARHLVPGQHGGAMMILGTYSGVGTAPRKLDQCWTLDNGLIPVHISGRDLWRWTPYRLGFRQRTGC